MSPPVVDAEIPGLLRKIAAQDRRAAYMASIRQTPSAIASARQSEHRRLTKRAEVLERAAELLDRAIEACDA